VGGEGPGGNGGKLNQKSAENSEGIMLVLLGGGQKRKNGGGRRPWMGARGTDRPIGLMRKFLGKAVEGA